jgi:transposase
MAKKKGRKCKYDTQVKPFLDVIDKMLQNGASKQQIADSLNITYATFNTYINQHEELAEICNKPRTNLVADLRSALVKKALGFQYEETKIYTTEDELGNKKKHIEKQIKQSLPDTTAIFGALNLYDEEYVKDKKAHKLKEQELELKKQALELKEW